MFSRLDSLSLSLSQIRGFPPFFEASNIFNPRYCRNPRYHEVKCHLKKTRIVRERKKNLRNPPPSRHQPISVDIYIYKIVPLGKLVHFPPQNVQISFFFFLLIFPTRFLCPYRIFDTFFYPCEVLRLYLSIQMWLGIKCWRRRRSKFRRYYKRMADEFQGVNSFVVWRAGRRPSRASGVGFLIKVSRPRRRRRLVFRCK